MKKPCADCAVEIEVTGPRKLYCAACALTRRQGNQAAYIARNIEQNRARARAWTAANPHKVRARRARKKAENPELFAEQEASRRKREAEKRRISAREYYWKNRERVLARLSTDEGRRYSRERMRENMKDPGRRLHSNVSRAIREGLRGGKGRRKWESLVGYTRDDLMVHLERQFTKGMTWENMGEWEIDHILPRCSFSFDSPDDTAFKACWAMTNLRPLWNEDNRAKSGNRLHLV